MAFKILRFEQFRANIRAEIEGLSVKQKIHFAWVCAVRAVPFLGLRKHFMYWDLSDRKKYLSLLFRALDITASLAYIDLNEARSEGNMRYKTSFARRAATAASAAQSGADAIDDSNSLRFVHDVVWATVYATKAADYATWGSWDCKIDKNLGKVNDSIVWASSSSYAASFDKEVFGEIIFNDIDAIRKNQSRLHNNDIGEYKEIWHVFLSSLVESGFEKRAKFFEELFKNGFKIDEATLKANIDNF